MDAKRLLRRSLGAAAYDFLTSSYFICRSVLPRGLVSIGEPHLPSAATDTLQERLSEGGVYLEYGAGGSTILAARTPARVVSVDSDRLYLRAVAEQLPAESRERFVLIHVDVGLTEKWGYPVFSRPTQRRVAHWREYAIAPWRFLSSIGEEPIVILIDGRFRVACVLESLLALGRGSRCLLLLDDYIGREDAYDAILPFICERKLIGRLLSFRVDVSMNRSSCATVLASFYRDPR